MHYPDVLDDLRRAYDAQVARRDGASQEPWKLTVREQFLARLQAERKTTLLEIGAGPGLYGRFFADAGLDVFCTDLSPAMVEACRAKGLRASVADFISLPAVIDAPVDAVFALNCLLHVPPDDLPPILEGIRTVLAPNGLFLLAQYGGIDFHAVREEDDYTPKRYFSFLLDDDMRRIASQAFVVEDFTVIELHGAREPELHVQALTLRNR